jgi:mannose-6-phosphate isomerase-like protein (cupin superfamily)
MRGIALKISKTNGEHYIWGTNCDGWHLVSQKDLSVIHERMPSGTAEVRHYHKESYQFFFVLSGTATMEVDGKIEILKEFEGVEIPPNTPHQMMNQSDRDVEFLVISTPTSKGDRVLV